MTYEKQTWNKYDDLKTEEENIQNGAVVTDNRMNHMEEGISAIDLEITSHESNKTNPHSVTKEQVGLSNVSNYGIATEAEAIAGTSNTKYMTPSLTKKAAKSYVDKTDVGLSNVDNVKQASKSEFDDHTANKTNPHGVTAAQVGAYTKSETDAKFKAVNDLIVSQDIPEGANLDDYKKEGEFSKKTPTVVTGAPEGVTGAFRLSVRSMVGSSGIFQTLYDYATRAIYYRIGNTTLGFNLTWQRIANNSEVVHLAGDETIEGKKTFTGSLEAQLLSSDGTPLRTATFDADGQALSTDRELTPLSMASGYAANAAEYCIKGGWIFITVQGARPTTNQTGSSYYTFLKLPSEIVEHLSHTEAFMWSNFQGGGAAYSGGILNTGEVHLYASPSSVTIGSNHRYSFSMVIPMRTTK
ncbi:pyocin knob domain-containing protein [Lactococcus petauri]|uniref:pyocin knob domain-containing protein n=1 Tax=Lactococcus petauri TaxID=1940789 RepID=UPI00254AFA81|nr:pyocin knob domain-containing protein [Lactococcus petauri]